MATCGCGSRRSRSGRSRSILTTTQRAVPQSRQPLCDHPEPDIYADSRGAPHPLPPWPIGRSSRSSCVKKSKTSTASRRPGCPPTPSAPRCGSGLHLRSGRTAMARARRRRRRSSRRRQCEVAWPLAFCARKNMRSEAPRGVLLAPPRGKARPPAGRYEYAVWVSYY